jgi:hypothetical protein
MTPLAPEAQTLSGKERLKEGLVDTLQNSVSILGELVDDFRSADRFFKYKALVLGGWFVLSVCSLGVACPGNTRPSNDIGVALVVSRSDVVPVYMVKNDSTEEWNNVLITVNGKYSSSLSRLEPNGGNITLTSAVLFDDDGKRAPSNLVVQDIMVAVQDPEGTVVVLKAGVVQTD